MADDPRLCPGAILGNCGSDAGVEIGIISTGSYKIYDKDKKDKWGVWSTTRVGGLVAVEYQWDAAEIAKLIDPSTGVFKVTYNPPGESAASYRDKLYLVLNVDEVIKGGRPILKDPPSGYETWVPKFTEWAQKNSSIAKEVLQRANLLISIESFVAIGLVDL
jgi:hypothetical protein